MPRFGKWCFWAEIAGAATCFFVFLATLVEPHLFELIFDGAPDGGDGSFEAMTSLGCSLILGILCAHLAHNESRRAAVRDRS